MESRKNFIGEFIGTFLMVLFGTGTVAVAVCFDQYQSIFQIAAMWGGAVTLAIYATRDLCCAHFNPAVSIAMVATGRMNKSKLPVYIIAQFAGALAAAFVIYFMFATNIEAYEAANGIVRGSAESRLSAKMFGEYYYFGGEQTVSMALAAAAEGIGTFILVFMIFALTEGCNTGRPSNNAAPIFIGITLSSVICLFASFSQAGFNPARDFAPRIVTLIFGWGSASFPDSSGGFFWVYMLAPVMGGLLAGLLFTKVVEPALGRQNKGCCC